MQHASNFINRSLGYKLVITITALVLFCGMLFWYAAIRNETRNSVTDVVSFTTSLSELTKQSIRHDMLTANRDDLQRTLENIVHSGSINKLKIVSTSGNIAYSSDALEIGTKSTDDSLLNQLDHQFFSDLPPSNKSNWRISSTEDGSRELTLIEPIQNEQDCFTASCHFHQENQKILGALKIHFPLQPIDQRLKTHKKETTLYLLFFVAIIAIVLSYILWVYVIKPVSELDTGMKLVSSGDLTHKVFSSSKDEIGRLAETFNEMTAELSSARHQLEKWNQSLEEEVKRQTGEIRKTQEKLIQAEKLAALGRLSADIAHEIRNPLTALGGFGRRLLKIATTDKQKEYSQIVVSEVNRLEKTLRDVLTFSREAKMDFSRAQVAEVVQESIYFLANIMEEHQIVAEVLQETDLPVLIDKAHIRQAINNLLLNAIEAMPKGGDLSLIIRPEIKNKITYVALHVSDTGPGIEEKKISLIFEPFYTGKPGQGTGLGLPISQKIMEEHGGFIAVKNKEEGGCMISLYFPYQAATEEDEVPCWQFMKCGRDTNSETKCPAYPHFGRVCWAVAGTLCAGKVQGTFAQKITTCQKCKFYLHIKDGETSV